MAHQLCKSSVVILCFFLVPTLSWALGTDISFKSVSMQGNTRLITYEYGSLGKRVLHDDTGRASLVALLTLIKQDYFKQKPSSDSKNFKNWKKYKPVVIANLSRMEAAYRPFCEGLPMFEEICQAIKMLKTNLNRNSVNFNDVFQLSNLLRNMEESLGFGETHRIDRYNPDGTKLDQQEEKASYMFSTKNLKVWLKTSGLFSQPFRP